MRRAGMPPIEQLPPVAARCRGCGRALRPLAAVTYGPVLDADGRERNRIVRRVFERWYSYYGFHSLRCAAEFADAAYMAGYRGDIVPRRAIR